MKRLLRDKGFIRRLFAVAVFLLVASLCFDAWVIDGIHGLASNNTGDPQADQWNTLGVLLWIVFFGIPGYIVTFAVGGLTFWSYSRLRSLNRQTVGQDTGLPHIAQNTQEAPAQPAITQSSVAVSAQPFDPTRPSANNAQPAGQHSTARSARDIRILNFAFLLVAILTVPLTGHILWAVAMKQYRMHVGLRLVLAFLSYVVGGGMVIAGYVANAFSGGALYGLLFIVGLVLFLAPFLYTFYRPLGHAQSS